MNYDELNELASDIGHSLISRGDACSCVTRYRITDDRISPTPDVLTADELYDYLRDMIHSNDWQIDLSSFSADEDGAFVNLPVSDLTTRVSRVQIATAVTDA